MHRYKAEYGPIYVLAGFLTVVVSLACHNGWQQLAHSPTVVVTKKKRESIHEIDEPAQANTAGGKFVDNSFLRKVAHIQDDSKSTLPRSLKDSIYTRYVPSHYALRSYNYTFIQYDVLKHQKSIA